MIDAVEFVKNKKYLDGFERLSSIFSIFLDSQFTNPLGILVLAISSLQQVYDVGGKNFRDKKIVRLCHRDISLK